MTDTERRTPYMRLWIDDVRGSCQDMSAAQFGAHMRMLMHAWERGSVPTEERKLRRIVGDIDWAEMQDVLERWVANGEGTVTHPRLERERERMMQQSDRRRKSGRKGADSRWDGKQDGKEDGKPHGNDDGKSMANTWHSHIPIVPDSQSPSSHNPTSPQSVAEHGARKRTPPDPIRWDGESWQGITDKDRADWAVAFPDVDFDMDLAKAALWIKAKPSRARKKNWRLFLFNWFGTTQSDGGNKVKPSAPTAAPRRLMRDESHIPENCHPDDRHRFFDGNFPTYPSLYHDHDGNLRSGQTGRIICEAKSSRQPSQSDVA